MKIVFNEQKRLNGEQTLGTFLFLLNKILKTTICSKEPLNENQHTIYEKGCAQTVTSQNPLMGVLDKFFPTGTYTGIGTSVLSLKHVMKSTTKKTTHPGFFVFVCGGVYCQNMGT